MYNSAVLQLFEVFDQAGIEAYVVGGAVRNHLLGVPIKDYDFAVASDPDRTTALLETAGIRVLKTGFEHGTITAMMGEQGYEITSFRKDIQTDGRHAEVQFGGDIQSDAMRRDFTINALYMDKAQAIHDPLGAMPDIKARMLRFVGDADARIREDYLRILRFYRFLAQYDLAGEASAQDACARLHEGLSNISAERIGAEMRGLMGGARRVEALEGANEAGVTKICLPDYNARDFARWVTFSKAQNLETDWRVETVAATPQIPANEWRLSRAQIRFMQALQEARAFEGSPEQLGEVFGSELGYWALQMRACRAGETVDPPQLTALQRGAKREFPISGNDLLDMGLEGKVLGEALKSLKAAWRNSNYTLDKNALTLMARDEINRGQK